MSNGIVAVTEVPSVNFEEPVGNGAAHSAFIWNGFDHLWQLRPHRIGGLGSYLDSETHSTNGERWIAHANAHFHFAPGVNGDWAQPTLEYALVQDPALSVGRCWFELGFTDILGDDDPPEAKTVVTAPVVIPLGRPELANGLRNSYIAVLRGWDMTVVCAPEKQGGEPCHSNSMWAYRLFLVLVDQHRTASGLACTARFELFRGKSPDFLKRPDRCLDVKVRVALTVLGGDNRVLRFTPAPPIQLASTVNAGPASVLTPLFATAGLPHATIALTGFGYELASTRSNQGRYMKSLVFLARPEAYQGQAGVLHVRAIAGFGNPGTDSDVTAEIHPVVLQLPSTAIVRRSQSQIATGTVCSSGAAGGFDCATDPTPGPLAERSTDVVSIDEVLDVA